MAASDEVPGAGFKWREDVLLRVMEANGIDKSNRDDFVRHAVNFDDDDNNYLKKAEIEAAAVAVDDVESDKPSPEVLVDKAEEESGSPKNKSVCGLQARTASVPSRQSVQEGIQDELGQGPASNVYFNLSIAKTASPRESG